MRDEKTDDKKQEDRQKEQTTPPRTKDFPLESPYYEEHLDPYFTEEPGPVKEEDQNQPVDPEEDWYWREPDNYWLEEGMWPWPEPRLRRKDELRPPEDVEPPNAKAER